MQRELLAEYHVNDPVSSSRRLGLLGRAARPDRSRRAGPSRRTTSSRTARTDDRAVVPADQCDDPEIRRHPARRTSSASSDPADYGKITVLQLPRTRRRSGPKLVQTQFTQITDGQLASINLLTQRRRPTVDYGNLLTLPVGGRPALRRAGLRRSAAGQASRTRSCRGAGGLRRPRRLRAHAAAGAGPSVRPGRRAAPAPAAAGQARGSPRPRRRRRRAHAAPPARRRPRRSMPDGLQRAAGTRSTSGDWPPKAGARGPLDAAVNARPRQAQAASPRSLTPSPPRARQSTRATAELAGSVDRTRRDPADGRVAGVGVSGSACCVSWRHNARGVEQLGSSLGS